MNKAARNERRKITATWLNGGAIAALAVGCFAPITGYATATTTISPLRLSILVASWIAISIALHMASRWAVGRMEE